MAINYEDLYAELRTVVAANWPTVVNGSGGRRIFEAEHVTAIPFEAIVAEHGLPYAVITVPEAEPISMGMANRTYALLVELYLIQETSKGAEGIRPLLETLCAYLRREGLTWGKCWDDPDPVPDWSWELEINEVLRSKKIPALAGVVAFVVVISETD